jgi:SAM-dependent methyltransferase
MQEKTMDDQSLVSIKEFSSGVPLLSDIFSGLNSPEFSSLASYSYQYLIKAAGELKNYPWIKDSFHQWSRILEYPYVYCQIKEQIASRARILDAGSGVTFFPFFLSQAYRVDCIDQDDYLSIYSAIGKKMSVDISFRQGNLTKLPFDNATFDCVYCVSVLEHTDRYPEIVAEFHRVLKPGAKLVLTFDIALDGNQFGVSQESAGRLLSCLKESFVLDQAADVLLKNLNAANIYSTHLLSSKGMYDLLPWPKFGWKQLLWSLLKGRPIVNNPNLTFCLLMGSKL